MNKFSDYEKFKNIASGIQSIIFSIAVIIGGGWTAYSFWALGSVEKARLEIEKEKYKRPVLDINIDIKLIKSFMLGSKGGQPSVQKPCMHVVVSVTNKGNYPSVLDFTKDTLFVCQMLSDTKGTQLLTNKSSYNVADVTRILFKEKIRAGNQQQYHYLVELKGWGPYMVEFRVQDAFSEENDLWSNSAIFNFERNMDFKPITIGIPNKANSVDTKNNATD